MQAYSGVHDLPTGHAKEALTEGCLVLEGGAWRGIYTQGALDALMENDINFQTTVGISAGALAGIGYTSGQIGWAPRINLTYRQDRNYCGIGAMRRDHGITGFSYLFEDLMKQYPIDQERFDDPGRRFVVGCTNCETGREEYFEKGKCEDFFKAVQASATVPYVSQPVEMQETPYLDGGIALKIPYHWAVRQKAKKIMVIKTRDRSFRAEEKNTDKTNIMMYHQYPNLVRTMHGSKARYNRLMDEIEQDEKDGKIFVLAPSKPLDISRFEKDMEKLGDLYYLGYHDMYDEMDRLKQYLSQPEKTPTSAGCEKEA